MDNSGAHGELGIRRLACSHAIAHELIVNGQKALKALLAANKRLDTPSRRSKETTWK